jgi:hypothetical protein
VAKWHNLKIRQAKEKGSDGTERNFTLPPSRMVKPERQLVAGLRWAEFKAASGLHRA